MTTNAAFEAAHPRADRNDPRANGAFTTKPRAGGAVGGLDESETGDPFDAYSEQFDDEQMRLLRIIVAHDPAYGGPHTTAEVLAEYEDLAPKPDGDFAPGRVEEIGDALSEARRRARPGGYMDDVPEIETDYGANGAPDGYTVGMRAGTGRFIAYRDDRDFGDNDLTGVAAAVSIAADIERDFDLVERQVRLLTPSVSDMRRTVVLADAMSQEKWVRWLNADGREREGTLRRGAWHGLSGVPSIAPAGTDPRTAGVRVTLSSGMDVYVPWSDLDDAMREDRLALG